MHLKTIRAALFAGGAVLVACLGITAPAQAVVLAPAAYIIEGNGVYTLVNNTALYVFQFAVTNRFAAQGAGSSTTQAGWSAYSCNGSCLGNSNSSFEYFDSSAVSDIGPGKSSSNFFFEAAPASTYTIYLHDAAGGNQVVLTGTAQTPGAVPEPATWALMLVGLGAAGTALRRRRSNGMASVAA